MTKRAFLAGVLGGVAMFLWMSLAHMVLPLGMIGIQEIPNEPAVLAAMNASLGSNHGLYFFPGMGLPPDASRQQVSAAMQQYEQKLATTPSGLLIYHPPGGKSLTPGQLATEFLTELLESLLAVWLLTRGSLPGFGARVVFVTIVGVIATVTTNVPYWNWYGFPTNYTLASMGTQIVGFLVVGLVAAALLKPRAA